MNENLLTAGFAGLLGLTYSELSADRIVVKWPVRPELLQPFGIVHGGVYCAVIETAASVGGALWLGMKGHVVGMSNQTDFLRPATSGDLTAVATPIHRGRRTQLWLVEITDEADRMIARGQVRLANVESTMENVPSGEQAASK